MEGTRDKNGNRELIVFFFLPHHYFKCMLYAFCFQAAEQLVFIALRCAIRAVSKVYSVTPQIYINKNHMYMQKKNMLFK